MSNAGAESRREPLDCDGPARDSRADRDRASARGPVAPVRGLPDRSGLDHRLGRCWRFVFSLLLTMGSQAGLGPSLVAVFVLTWGYGAFCEGLFNGQTVGKHAMGIRVISERGVPISGAQAVLRNLVGSVDGLVPFFYQTALASMILSPKFQRLGDLAAGTMVVIEERRWRRGVTRIDDPEVAALLPWLPGRIAAGSDLARVLSDYVEARGRFGPLRRAEMAEPLARPAQKAVRNRPISIPADAVLCAVYHQIFVGE